MEHRNGVPPSQQPTGREAFLAIVLCLFVGVGATVFLVFVTGGFFAWVILIALGIGLLIGLHYLVWGWSMPPTTDAERQQLEKEAQEDEAGARRPWERRFR
jgi:hypothetical protein